MGMCEIFLKVSGQVQGVGFRAHTRQIARDLKINGWVKNEQDGSVSIYARSDKKTLDLFQIRLKNIKHNLGPNVQELIVVNKNSSPIDKTIIGFQIKY